MKSYFSRENVDESIFFKDLDIRYRYTKSSDVDTSAKYKHPTSEEFPS